MSDSDAPTREDRIADILDRFLDAEQERTRVLASIGRDIALIKEQQARDSRNQDLLRGEVRNVLDRLTKAESRVAGVELAIDDERNGNGHG